ncbi:MAG: tRNA guanosine(34) transglycosylase Tgt [archaeon]
MQEIFKIKFKDKKTKARIGLLKTRKGTIETPFFMPVASKGGVKHFSSKDLEEIGIDAVISNTLLLHLKPGEKVIKKLGGIGKFMNFRGINVTDSGGFQMYSDRIYISSNDEGVLFRNPFTSEKIFITPEKDMEIQVDIGADIIMCLDSMPLLENSKKEIGEAVRKTTSWAKRCKEHHDKIQKNIPKEKRQILFGICQGGIHKDLREKSAKEMLKVNFEGYSIGGLALGETHEQEIEAIKIQKEIIPQNKPVYLMGAGHPYEVLDAISLGIDMFDSRYPTQNARRGTIFTWSGKLRIFRGRYKEDKNPIDKKCKCFACKNYSRAYIRHLLLQEEGLGYRIASYHNLYFMHELIEKAKDAIRNGKFSQLKEKVRKAYSN